ncbi:MAG: phosphotransferase [Woeseia sp.]|nr:phosphotransferase [Woeseia sp.]NNL54535.1 phosphotransferase [Woeseia sp.]
MLLWLRDDTRLQVRRLLPASKDASFRRYFRVYTDDAQYIAMDAPPEKELSEPFVRVAGWFAEMGLNSPRVLAEDLGRGFLLLTDLGETQYLDALQHEPDKVLSLYHDALGALVKLQREGSQFQTRLPPYDRALLTRELGLFRDWLCGTKLELKFSSGDEKRWQKTCEFLINAALTQPRVFVHRDYHSRNLMVCDDDNPGILDFQDAVEGALTYDLVSMLRDCYISWPLEFVDALARKFFADSCQRLPEYKEAQFLRDFDLSGVQRHLKAAGIFARLEIRDGKAGYLKDVPRTLSYVSAVAPRYPELAFLDTLIVDRVLPGLGMPA